jgi:hypothetical protein
VYRRLCQIDILDRAKETMTPRSDYLSGAEADMRGMFNEFENNPQVLAVELRDHLGTIVARFDRLADTLPAVDPAALRLAVLEPPLLAKMPAAHPRPTG